MPLPDVEASRAVLIGTAGYRYLEPLPAVANNLDGLAALLRDPDLWGLPKEHCSVVLNPRSGDELLEVVRRAAQEATDTLLIYYAGHGLLDNASDLLLTLPDSDAERMYRAVRYADIRREILDSRQCRNKAVILDCCFSGSAAVPAAVNIADQAVVDGAWLLTATAGNEPGPPQEQYTAFTAELINVLDNGIVDGPELIDADALYLRMWQALKAKRRPLPQQRTRNEGHLITFARNRAKPSSPQKPNRPVLEDEGPYLRLTPAALADSVAELRAQGRADTADAVLAGSGRRRPDQEVAAIMVTLASLGRPKDVAAVAFAASGRDPHELRRIYEVLVEIEQRRVAIGLLKVVAAGLPERTARFVTVLDDPGAGDAVPMLLRAAVGYAEKRPHRLVDLLNALYLARREPDTELLLAEAQRVLAPDDLAVVADALRDGGRDEQANELYGQAAAAVVRREPAQIAAIVAALSGSGTPHVDRRLAQLAVAARTAGPPEHLAGLIAAFEAAGLDQVVTDAVGALGATLARPVLAEVTRALRERGCDSAALRLYLAAAADGPVDDILRLNDSLNEQGRLLDALDLLAHAARVRSIADLDRMTADRGPRNRRIFAAVAGQRQPRRAAALYRMTAERNDGRREQFRTELISRPEPDIVAVVAELLGEQATELADDLLLTAVRAVGATTPQRLAAAAVDARHLRTVMRLAAVAAGDDLPWIFHEVLRGFPRPGDAEERIAALLPELPRRTIADVVAWICDLDRGDRGAFLLAGIAALPAAGTVTVAAALALPDDLLAVLAGRPLSQVGELAAELRRRDERALLRTLVEVFRDRHPGDPDVFKLASWLWLLEERELAVLALRGRLWVAERAIEDALAIAVAELLHGHAVRTERGEVAYPALMQTGDADELSRAYGLATDELCLLVLSWSRTRRLTPVLFTERGVHHAATSRRYAYPELRDVHIALGKRNAVVFSGQVGPPESWTMPSAAAARELVDLLTEIRTLAHEFAESLRTSTHVDAQPVPPGVIKRYELEGEAS